MHKSAFKAAEAVRCAGDQGKFWEMHDRLFENQRALEPFGAHAAAIGLDTTRFEACLAKDTHAAAIRADMSQAQAAGITGTPGFVLATTDPKNPRKAVALTFMRGARPFESFKEEIDKALAAAPR